MTTKNRSQGYLLPMVIIFVFISGIIGWSILYLGRSERLASKRRLFREQAFYLAEAGAQRALAYLKANPSWEPEDTPQSLAGGTFSVTRQSQGTNNETIIVTSTGTFKGVEETVELYINSAGGGPRHSSSWGQGLFGSQSVTLANNSVIDSYDSRLGAYGGSNVGQDGDVGTKGSILMANNSTIRGDAFVTGGPGSITMGNGAVITGDKNYNYTFDDPLNDLSAFPVIIPSSLSSLPYPSYGDPRITVNSGSYTLSNGTLTLNNNALITISGGDFRFYRIVMNNNSQLTINNDSRFYIENNFTMNNNTQLIMNSSAEMVLYLGSNASTVFANNSIMNNQSNTPGNFRIYTNSSSGLTLANNAQALNCVVYAPNAIVTLANNSQFYGGIVARNITLANNSLVHYDVSLRDTDFPDDPWDDGGGTSPSLSVIRWRKPNWQQ
ncbi:MAG TPA: hypothetical protein PKW42_01505 [bacterium]|nr:hypothetical protein [bacterium]